MTEPSRKTAVVLFNLGGPDGPEAVEPFLFNLFSDPAIIGLPQPLRWLVAKLISRRRAPVAREIYAELGGGSPLLPNTEAQAAALQSVLDKTAQPGESFRVFIAMRYWSPRSGEIAKVVAAYAPDRVVLLPLYPQFSTTTSGSSAADWQRAAAGAGLRAPTTTVCCYPRNEGLIDQAADLIAAGLDEAGQSGRPRLLFSAHGLPKKIVERGDPYQWQVEQSAAAIAERLAQRRPELQDLDWVVCYQSRVGPLEWIGPSTDAEVQRAGRDGVPVVLFPVAFVSEHSETLVELDIEYRKLAEENGVPAYHRVATVGIGAQFIAGLAATVRQSLACEGPIYGPQGTQLCPASWQRCPQRTAA